MSATPTTPLATATSRVVRAALLGQPNTGKTTLFNRLCGVRARTGNLPGTTVESRVGLTRVGTQDMEVMDLPGTYGLHLELPESRVCRECIEGRIGDCAPDVVVLVADATNLAKSLRFVVPALRRRLPCVVAVTLADEARRKGLSVDAARLQARLGCPVHVTSGRTGEGVEAMAAAAMRVAHQGISDGVFENRLALLPSNESDAALAAWCGDAVADSIGGAHAIRADALSDRVDAALTHPVSGGAVFVMVMALLFTAIFWLAKFPMDGIDWIFTNLGGWLQSALPEGALRNLLVDGVVGGVAGTVVFLPQIALLFFMLSLLEDSGYLARAAFAADRFMRRFGLPGQAFVPLLSSHACALPGILSTRLIPDPKDRLATILVAPFMSCTARLPVYVLLISLLFAGRPWLAGIAFMGCYATGALAGLLSALLARRTILRGPARPMVLELPPYRRPSVRTALWVTWDRARLFLSNAGTMILAICVVMWWLSAYPAATPSAELDARFAEAARLREGRSLESIAQGAALQVQAEGELAQKQQLESFAGRIGRVAEPAFAPLGFDHQLTVATLTSFLAREVFVSTLSVLQGASSEDDEGRMIERIARGRRLDGTPLLDVPTSAALLAFFTLAMQCLPTLALVRRETGSWKWPLLQLAWMSCLAWTMAFAVRHTLLALGVT
ncbi:MAG: ferrous iron transporter B [Phycisphaerales bacterium]